MEIEALLGTAGVSRGCACDCRGTVTHALCLALTLSTGGVFALEEFLIKAELHDNHDELSRLLIDNHAYDQLSRPVITPILLLLTR